VKPTKTFNSDGQWEIAIKTSDKEETRVFDAVLICTGHHAEKNIPNFPGLNKFKGKVTHTHDYKDYHGYEDKNVLIIGIGNSGGDVATELSRISSQV
jgi:dimethylaniline monooxygenase (N-oxide forming)